MRLLNLAHHDVSSLAAQRHAIANWNDAQIDALIRKQPFIEVGKRFRRLDEVVSSMESSAAVTETTPRCGISLSHMQRMAESSAPQHSVMGYTQSTQVVAAS